MADDTQIGGDISFPQGSDPGDSFTYINETSSPTIETVYQYDDVFHTWTSLVGPGGAPAPELPEITQYPIIESPDDKVGSRITATTKSSVTVANKTGEAWFKDGVDLNETGNSIIPKEDGKYKYVEYWTPTSRVATREVIEVESNELEIEYDLTKPFSELYGYRVDGNTRCNYMSNESIVIPKTDKFTLSFWLKQPPNFPGGAGSSGYMVFFSSCGAWSVNSWDLGISIDKSHPGGIKGDYNIYIYANEQTSPPTYGMHYFNDMVFNRWYHFVIQGEGKTASMSCDNRPFITKSKTTNAFAGVMIGDSGCLPNSQWANSYLSEIYMVHGRHLEPTDFGKDYGGKWGPLDNSVILENIKSDPAGFGDKGFYLPFNKNSAPIKQRAHLVPSGKYEGPLESIFTGWHIEGVHRIETLKLEGFKDLEGKTLEFALSCANGKNVKCTVNGTVSKTEAVPSAAPYAYATKWIAVDINGGSVGALNSIEVESVDGPGNLAAFYGLILDGKRIVDANAIGIDHSGNENHFGDQHNAVGNLDKIWSRYLYMSDSTYNPNASTQVENIASYGFDGTNRTVVSGDDAGGWLYFRPDEPLTSEACIYVSTQEADEIRVNGSPVTTVPALLSDANQHMYAIPYSGDVNEIAVKGSGSKFPNIGSIEINAMRLVDFNIQDSVSDTPMKMYSTLDGTAAEIFDTGLKHIASKAGTSAASDRASSVDFYYEATTFNNDAVIGVSNDSPKLNNFPGQNAYSIGLTSDGHIIQNNIKTPYDFGIEPNDLIGVGIRVVDNKIIWYKNGVPGAEVDFSIVGDKCAQVRNCVVNFGQQPFANPNLVYNIDDTVTVGGITYDSLYQIWEDFARTVLGFEEDKIAKLKNTPVADLLNELSIQSGFINT